MAERTQKDILEDVEARLTRIEDALRASAAREVLVAQALSQMDKSVGFNHAVLQTEIKALRDDVGELRQKAGGGLTAFIRAAVADPWTLRLLTLAALALSVALATAVGGEMLPTTISVLLNRDSVKPALQIAPSEPVSQGQE